MLSSSDAQIWDWRRVLEVSVLDLGYAGDRALRFQKPHASFLRSGDAQIRDWLRVAEVPSMSARLSSPSFRFLFRIL